MGTDPGEANRRGSAFFLTLEIVLREDKGAIYILNESCLTSDRCPGGRSRSVVAGWARSRVASGSRNRGPSGGWQDHPDRRRRSGPAGASSGSVKTRKPGLLRAQTSLPIFFFLFWKKPRAFSVSETTSGDFYLFPLRSAAQALRALRVPSVPGHQRKAQGPSPTAPPTSALSCSSVSRTASAHAPLRHLPATHSCACAFPAPGSSAWVWASASDTSPVGSWRSQGSRHGNRGASADPRGPAEVGDGGSRWRRRLAQVSLWSLTCWTCSPGSAGDHWTYLPPRVLAI